MNKTYDTPDEEEIFQQDQVDNPVVHVVVDNVVRTDEMPTTNGFILRSAPTTGVKLLQRDDRRKGAIGVSDQDLYLGSTIGDVQNAAGAFRWPANTPFPLASGDEVFAAGAGADANVSILVENWAR